MKILLRLIFILGLGACSTPSSIRPIGAQKQALQASLGGAFFNNLGPALPLPEITLGYRYGLSERLDAYAQLGITSTIFGGSPLHLGAVYHWNIGSPEWDFGTGGGVLSLISWRNTDKSSDGTARLALQRFTFFPYLEAVGSYEFNSTHLVYLHGLAYLQIPPTYDSTFSGNEGFKATAVAFPWMVASLSLGHQMTTSGLHRFRYEVLWGGVGQNWLNATVDYYPSLPSGALGVRFGYEFPL